MKRAGWFLIDKPSCLPRRPRLTQSYQVRAASSVPVVDRTVPLMQWTERLIQDLRKTSTGPDMRHVTEEECPAGLRPDWKEFTSGFGLWCPLKHPGGQILGGLWLTQGQPWADHEKTVLQRLSEAYAYAWRAVGPSNSRQWRWGLSRTMMWILAAATLGALAIPVPMSTLAPAKIVAKNPLIVSAPIDGVIAEILVLPNTVVFEGQVLFTFEDTTFRSEYDVAERNLDVAMAQYRRAAQGSFVEAEQKADVPLLKAEVELRETERNYAHERLTKVEVKAEQAGLLLYTDKVRLDREAGRGRPTHYGTGESATTGGADRSAGGGCHCVARRRIGDAVSECQSFFQRSCHGQSCELPCRGLAEQYAGLPCDGTA